MPTVVLGTHVRLHSLAVLGTAFVDVLSSPVGADERDGSNVFVITDEVDTLVRTVYDVHNALRQIDLVEKLHQNHRCTRHSLGRLQNKSVSSLKDENVFRSEMIRSDQNF